MRRIDEGILGRELVTFRCTIPPREGDGHGVVGGQGTQRKAEKEGNSLRSTICEKRFIPSWAINSAERKRTTKQRSVWERQSRRSFDRSLTPKCSLQSGFEFRCTYVRRARRRNVTLTGRRPGGRAGGPLLCPATSGSGG